MLYSFILTTFEVQILIKLNNLNIINHDFFIHKQYYIVAILQIIKY